MTAPSNPPGELHRARSEPHPTAHTAPCGPCVRGGGLARQSPDALSLSPSWSRQRTARVTRRVSPRASGPGLAVAETVANCPRRALICDRSRKTSPMGSSSDQGMAPTRSGASRRRSKSPAASNVPPAGSGRSLTSSPVRDSRTTQMPTHRSSPSMPDVVNQAPCGPRRRRGGRPETVDHCCVAPNGRVRLCLQWPPPAAWVRGCGGRPDRTFRTRRVKRRAR